MSWISPDQFERDHNGLRNVCAADGHEGTERDPLALDDGGLRVHASHFSGPDPVFRRRRDDDTIADAAPADNERSRYVLNVPRGLEQFMDNLHPHASSHPLTVCGRADLDRRLAEAERIGVNVTYQRLDEDEDVA